MRWSRLRVGGFVWSVWRQGIWPGIVGFVWPDGRARSVGRREGWVPLVICFSTGMGLGSSFRGAIWRDEGSILFPLYHEWGLDSEIRRRKYAKVKADTLTSEIDGETGRACIASANTAGGDSRQVKVRGGIARSRHQSPRLPCKMAGNVRRN